MLNDPDPGPLFIRTRCPDTSLKATLWMKTQNEGSLTPPCIVWKNLQIPHSLTRGLKPPEQLERQEEFHSSDKTWPDSPVPTLQGHYDRSQNWRGRLRFLPPLEMRPSSIAPNPVESREATLTPQYP